MQGQVATALPEEDEKNNPQNGGQGEGILRGTRIDPRRWGENSIDVRRPWFLRLLLRVVTERPQFDCFNTVFFHFLIITKASIKILWRMWRSYHGQQLRIADWRDYQTEEAKSRVNHLKLPPFWMKLTFSNFGADKVGISDNVMLRKMRRKTRIIYGMYH